MQTRWMRLAGFLAVGFLAGCQQQQKVGEQGVAAPAAGSGYVFAQGFPTSDSAQKATDNTDFGRAVQAYRFWYRSGVM